MNKVEAESVLDRLLEWKAIPVACMNKVKKELKDPAKCPGFLDWFNKSKELKALLQARALVSEDMWLGYKCFQMNGLQEQEIFYNARRAMVQAFKDRYPRPAKELVVEGVKYEPLGV